MKSGVFYGLASAALFGISTPLAKALVGSVPPLWVAALLYLGAGLGLLVVLGLRRVRSPGEKLTLPPARDWGWIGAAIGLGGIAGPVALMYGLTTTSAASASLLLNLEAVLTALLAWFLFKENFDRRIALGMLVIVAGAALLTVAPGTGDNSLLAVAGALMALGVWLHVSEHHAHEHHHEPVEHTHAHIHDVHHQHEHQFLWKGEGSHVHPHVHVPLAHSHPHYPDVHHRHPH